MDKDEKQLLLKRMKAAIKNGQVQRKADLRQMGHSIWAGQSDELERGFMTEEHRDRVSTAYRLGMIRTNYRHWEDPFDTGVKRAEPYQKRPAVRASKKARQKSSGLSL